MFVGNDVIAISSLGSASGNFWLQILKGQPPLYIHVQLTLVVYLERFRRFSAFYILLGFPYGQNNAANVKWEKNTWSALPYAKLRLLSQFAWTCLYPFGLCRCARKKGSKAGRQEGRMKVKSQEVYISRMCGATPSGGFQPNLAQCVRLTDVIKRANFHRYNLRGFGAVRCWSFHVAIRNQGRPKTPAKRYHAAGDYEQ